MSAHTPTTWRFVEQKAENGKLYVRCEEGREHGEGYGVAIVLGKGLVEQKANGHLISAAPNLLTQLKLAVMRLARVDGGDSIVVSNALDAIHAATGEAFDFEAAIAAEDAMARGL